MSTLFFVLAMSTLYLVLAVSTLYLVLAISTLYLVLAMSTLYLVLAQTQTDWNVLYTTSILYSHKWAMPTLFIMGFYRH